MKTAKDFLKIPPELPEPSPVPGIDPEDSVLGDDIVNRLRTNSARKYGKIDIRIEELETEFKELNRTRKRIIREGGIPPLSLDEKIEINHDLCKVLLRARVS